MGTVCTTLVSNQRQWQRQLVSLASSCVLRVCCIIYVVIYTFIMEVGSQSVGRNESSRWPHAAENAGKKITKPDTKNSIYKHPKRRRRRRQGTAAQSFANESTIFYCHCWALNAKHTHTHTHANKGDKQFRSFARFYLRFVSVYLVSAAVPAVWFQFIFIISIWAHWEPHPVEKWIKISKVFLRYTAIFKKIDIYNV